MLVIMLIRRVVKLGDYSDDDAYDRDMFTGGFDSVTVEDGSTGYRRRGKYRKNHQIRKEAF